jgi:N-acetylmuramoyl-L-alanine amidase
VRGYNPQSIGIELVNRGRYPHWFDSHQQTMTEPYTAAQIASLRALLAQLRADYPNLDEIAGHEDLDVARVAASDDPTKEVPRKLDPGPLFPWAEVLAGSGLKRIGASH